MLEKEIAMSINTEQFANAQKAQVENLLTLANTAFASAERIAALNLNAARALFEDSANSARALLGAKDIQEVISLQTAYAQPAVEKAVNWSRGLYEITSETREELSKVLEAQLTEATETLTTTLEQAAKNAPAGTDAAVSALKSAVGAANVAYATFAKAARQVGEYADASIAAAAPVKPASKPKKAA